MRFFRFVGGSFRQASLPLKAQGAGSVTPPRRSSRRYGETKGLFTDLVVVPHDVRSTLTNSRHRTRTSRPPTAKGRHRTLGGAAKPSRFKSHRDLGVRRPAPLVEPGTVLRRHLRALRLRRMPLTRGCLLAVFRRAPPHLHAVVRVIGHFEVCCPVDDLLERKRPLRAIAAGVGYFSRGKLGRNYPLQLAFHVPDALVLRHRVARRQPNDAIG